MFQPLYADRNAFLESSNLCTNTNTLRSSVGKSVLHTNVIQVRQRRGEKGIQSFTSRREINSPDCETAMRGNMRRKSAEGLKRPHEKGTFDAEAVFGEMEP